MLDEMLKQSIENLAAEQRIARQEQREDLKVIWLELKAASQDRRRFAVALARVESAQCSVGASPIKRHAAPAVAGAGAGALLLGLAELVSRIL